MKNYISFKNVRKEFGKTSVLNDIHFTIEKGEILGLLGVNGAGKTTLIRSFLGLLRTTQGEIYFQDDRLENKCILERFGFLPENFFPPTHLKAYEFLGILGRGLGLKNKDIDHLFKLVNLDQHKKKFIKSFSRGMIQRLGLCCALLKDPEILILDEPSLGLDPIGQKDILELMQKLNGEGKTIFFSSHSLAQIERVCSRIGILHKGTIQFIGTPQELKNKYTTTNMEEAFFSAIKVC